MILLVVPGSSTKMPTQTDEVKLTAEEVASFEKAFSDESFRKLMADYVCEISDPKHKEETEGEHFPCAWKPFSNEHHYSSLLTFSPTQPTLRSWR
jgi:hypothetical protein